MFNNFFKTVLVIFAASSLMAGTARAFPSEGQIRQQIDEVLVQRHPHDNAEWWRALGPSAPGVIIQMYGETTSTYRQTRLIGALGYYEDSPEALEFLKKEAASTQKKMVRRTAVKGIGLAGGVGELDTLEEYLQHEDPHTRYAAAQALRSIHHPSAAQALQRYAAKEKQSWIVEKLREEPKKSVAPLQNVGVAPTPVNPAMEGEWKGYLLVPGAKDSFVPKSARLKLKLKSQTKLTGELWLEGAKDGALRHWILQEARGESETLILSLPQDVAGSTTKAGESASRGTLIADGRFVELAGTHQLQFQVPELGATLLLRKSSQ